MANAALLVSAAALAFGAGLGLKGLFDPIWAGKLVRLQADNGQPEGFAEFRSTFGGMFLGLHLTALICLIISQNDYGIAACAILTAGWLFTAVGRIMAYRMDKDCRDVHVIRSIIIEVVIAALIAVWPIVYLLKPAA